MTNKKRAQINRAVLQPDLEHKDYEVGYKRPSKAHQFQKGYSPHRNYRGRPKKQQTTIADEIEDAFATPVRVRSKPGSPFKVITAFELIVSRLFEKAMKGDSSALKVLVKYEIYAERKPKVKIIKNPPSREDSVNHYAKLLEADEDEAQEQTGPRKFEIDGIPFTSESSLKEIAEAYYRWIDRTNQEEFEKDEKKVRRRKFV